MSLSDRDEVIDFDVNHEELPTKIQNQRKECVIPTVNATIPTLEETKNVTEDDILKQKIVINQLELDRIERHDIYTANKTIIQVS